MSASDLPSCLTALRDAIDQTAPGAPLPSLPAVDAALEAFVLHLSPPASRVTEAAARTLARQNRAWRQRVNALRLNATDCAEGQWHAFVIAAALEALDKDITATDRVQQTRAAKGVASDRLAERLRLARALQEALVALDREVAAHIGERLARAGTFCADRLGSGT